VIYFGDRDRAIRVLTVLCSFSKKAGVVIAIYGEDPEKYIFFRSGHLNSAENKRLQALKGYS